MSGQLSRQCATVTGYRILFHSHDMEELAIVASSCVTTGFDADLAGGIRAEVVECQLADQGTIGGGVSGPDPTFILAKGGIEAPVHLISLALDDRASPGRTRRHRRADSSGGIGSGRSPRRQCLDPR